MDKLLRQLLLGGALLLAVISVLSGTSFNGDTNHNCMQHSLLGVSGTSELHLYDPDGSGPNTALHVQCDGPETVINTYGVGAVETIVEGFAGSGSYEANITYGNESLSNSIDMVRSVVDVALNCRFPVNITCQNNEFNTSSWFVDYSGTVWYWQNTTLCPGGECNCAQNDDVRREDSGSLTEKEYLPIHTVYFGDTANGKNGTPAEFITYDVDDLYCTHPIPDCGSPSVGPGVLFTINGTTYNNTVVYSCDEGYEYASGENITTCQIDSTWGSVLQCRGVSCGTPPNVTNASPIGSDFIYSNNVTYGCNEGYELSNTSSSVDGFISCQSNGSWTVLNAPDCTGVSCGDPGSLLNGYMEASSFTHPYSVIAYCLDGYQPTSGNLIRLCQANGNWSGEPPVCEDINECDLKDTCAQNYGNNTCFNYAGGYNCTCDLSRFTHVNDGLRNETCQDIDECIPYDNPCKPANNCTNLNGSYSCQCNQDGYTLEIDANTNAEICQPKPVPPVTIFTGIATTNNQFPVVVQIATNITFEDRDTDPFDPSTKAMLNAEVNKCTAIHSNTPGFDNCIALGHTNGSLIINYAVILNIKPTADVETLIGLNIYNDIVANGNTLVLDTGPLSVIDANGGLVNIVYQIDSAIHKVPVDDACFVYKSFLTCLNGASCSVLNGQPSCQCSAEFVGKYCEEFASSSGRMAVIVSASLLAFLVVVACVTVLAARGNRIRAARQQQQASDRKHQDHHPSTIDKRQLYQMQYPGPLPPYSVYGRKMYGYPDSFQTPYGSSTKGHRQYYNYY